MKGTEFFKIFQKIFLRIGTFHLKKSIMYKKPFRGDMNLKKAFVLLVFTLFLIPAFLVSSSAFASDVTLNDMKRYNEVVIKSGSSEALAAGKKVNLDASPYIEDGTLMVPVRFICKEVLDADVLFSAVDRTVRINTSLHEMVLKIESSQVAINNRSFSLPKPPAVKEERVFVPLRFLAEVMGIKVTYNPADRTASLTALDPDKLKPSADFTLPSSLVAGQRFYFEDYSRDPAGHSIIDSTWKVIKEGQEILQTRSLSEFFSRPDPGEYFVMRRVRNQYNIWSDWSEQRLLILPNKPPEIIDFTVDTPVSRGTPLTFSYDIDNEPWEKITAQRWSYSFENEGELKVITEKPRAFFEAGSYQVHLQVKDEYGSWSPEAVVDIEVSPELVKTEKEFKFGDPVPGEVFLNMEGVNYLELEKTPVNEKVAEVEGTLIMSNNPESVISEGILYQDSASGKVRIKLHHSNISSDVLYFYAAAQNVSEEPVPLFLGVRGLAGPSWDVMQVGRQVVATYLDSLDKTGAEKILQPGETVILNEERTRTMPGETLSFMMDLESQSELQFTVFASKQKITSSGWTQLPFAEKEGSHVRGTFWGADQTIKIVPGGINDERFVLGMPDNEFFGFSQGQDALTKEEVFNRGDRGAVYNIEIHAEETMGVALNPRGRYFKGAIKGFNDNLIFLSNAGMMRGSREAVVLGTLAAGDIGRLVYSHPSGSDTPFFLLFFPQENW